ncbi:DNA annealing helicase and endonuclease ZRANB3-like [Lampris incognitus]|uniref:DNA annealing helicase and endonuclease ZRANB3-like n=1 Tax=Lampris incognitus TaxID=2546036 RepID=UPI0024B48F9C|nr:DNA annealing helicase and endonuclease ZRANB3-like [Lampris incognitus]
MCAHSHTCGYTGALNQLLAEPSLSRSTAAANDDGDGVDDEARNTLPLYAGLKFCASRNTDRIHLYTKDDVPLNCNFVPLDITLDNWDDLPQALSQHPENKIQVLRFVQQWSGLAAMKQRLLRRSGLLFHSPSLGLEQLSASQRPHSSTNRYLSKKEVAEASIRKAQTDGGSVRLVTRENFFNKRRSAPSLPPPDLER